MARYPTIARALFSLVVLVLVLVLASCVEAPGKLSLEQYTDRLEEDAGVTPIPDKGPPTELPPDGGTLDPDEGVDGDTAPPDPDDGPVCVPDPEGGDWCDGIDNDCDGLTDEDGGVPAIVEPFEEDHGWRRASPGGTVTVVKGPVPFLGYVDTDTVVWNRTVAWRGDIELDIRLVIAQILPGAELFIGTWAGEQAPGWPDPEPPPDDPPPDDPPPDDPPPDDPPPEDPPPEDPPSEDPPGMSLPTGRVGITVQRWSETSVIVRALVLDEVVVELEASPSEFLGVLMRVSTGLDEVSLKLRKGDGSVVKEKTKGDVTTIPVGNGLAISVTGGPIVGSVAKIGMDPGPECTDPIQPQCANAAACGAAEPCRRIVCNPFVGCDEQPVYCPLESGCLLGGVCNLETSTCSQAPRANDAPCDNGEGCIVGSVCVDGACTGGDPLVCPEPGQCQEPAECVAFANACVFPPKGLGTPCDDGSLCTLDDGCKDGECLPASEVTCEQGGPCDSESLCDLATGECSEPTPLPNGEACDDGDGCTETDVCTDGLCAGIPNDCNDGNPCTLDACADGACSHDPSAECVAWETMVGAEAAAPVALVGDTIVAIGDGLYGLGLDGTEQWKSPDVTGPLTRTPSIGASGNVYVADTGGGEAGGEVRIVAVASSDGSTTWVAPIPNDCLPGDGDPCRVLAPPTEGQDGTVYVTTVQAGAHAFGPDGQAKWSFDSYQGGHSSVVATAGGAVFMGAGGTKPSVLSLDSDGGLRWSFPTVAEVKATPVVASGTVYYFASDTVGALADGLDAATETWTVSLGTTLAATEAVLTPAGALLVANTGTIYAIDTLGCDGTLEKCVSWTLPITGGAAPGPGFTLLADSQLVFGAGGLHFQPLPSPPPEGEPELEPPPSLVLGLPDPGSPVVHASGLLIVGAADGQVRGITWKAGAVPAASSWPMYHRGQTRNATSD